MFINFNAAKADPNVNDMLSALQNSNIVGINFTHLKPTKVIKNTPKNYVARYQDNHGSYVFEIRKTGNTYTVISDGVLVMSGVSKDRMVWEFENQINSNPIRCI